MKNKLILILALLGIYSLILVGYAHMTDSLMVNGSVSIKATRYDVYISNVSYSGTAVQKEAHASTVLTSYVQGTGTVTMSIDVTNRSDKTYVFERVITGESLEIDGIYDGTKITYQTEGLTPLITELAPYGGTVRFTLTLNCNDRAATAAAPLNYILKFNFMEKGDVGILPGGDETTTPESTTSEPEIETPDPEESETSEPEPEESETSEPEPEESETSASSSQTSTEPTETTKPGTEPDGFHSDFLGLVEALLSDQEDCLNSDSTLIHDAVQHTIYHNKRPKEDAPAVHCGVNSVSGGTMSSIAITVNQKLTSEVQFILEADLNNPNRMYLYMYYESHIDAVADGAYIMTYMQVLTRIDTGEWIADGTYPGMAEVGEFYAGGNNGKDERMIDAYSWYYDTSVLLS